DRLALYVMSRSIFGDAPTALQTLRALLQVRLHLFALHQHGLQRMAASIHRNSKRSLHLHAHRILQSRVKRIRASDSRWQHHSSGSSWQHRQHIPSQMPSQPLANLYLNQRSKLSRPHRQRIRIQLQQPRQRWDCLAPSGALHGRLAVLKPLCS
ncbi:MAG: hypothetical protein ACN6O1_21725, partial [Comamonas sp.]|uniref:hypothetical protein n=1 Tax=Comamonas sp. TaxID=34028 RepID=UPI003D1342E3